MGERIIKQRQRLGLSQKKLARKVGLSPDTIVEWEKSENKPSRDLLRIMAALFTHGGLPQPICKIWDPAVAGF